MKWAILGGILGPNSPQNCPIWLKLLPGVVLNDATTVSEESLKNSNFFRNGR